LHLRFGVFLAIWLVSFAGAAAVFSLYPVLMQQVFGITPGLSSIAFAVAAGLGLALYAPAGHWSEHSGPDRVLQTGLGLRLLAFLGLMGLGLVNLPGRQWLALLGFALVVLAWSLLSVGGTALTAYLAPTGEGAGMGIFNATTAVAGVVGAVLGGWVAGHWGYAAVSGLAAVGVALGFLFALSPSHRKAT
jgi:predicted MFS family arabinose efflux permease